MSSETDLLIYQHIAEVPSFAKRIATRINCVDYDDLLGAGYEGLVKAARDFKKEYGVKFMTYAEFRIIGTIRDCVRMAIGRSETSEGRLNFEAYPLEMEDNLSDNFADDLDDVLESKYLLKVLFDSIDSSLGWRNRTKERNKSILQDRYINEMTLQDIGDRHNLTESRISQIIDRFEQKARKNGGNNGRLCLGLDRTARN